MVTTADTTYIANIYFQIGEWLFTSHCLIKLQATLVGYEMQFSQYLQQGHISIALVLCNTNHPSLAPTWLMTPKAGVTGRIYHLATGSQQPKPLFLVTRQCLFRPTVHSCLAYIFTCITNYIICDKSTVIFVCAITHVIIMLLAETLCSWMQSSMVPCRSLLIRPPALSGHLPYEATLQFFKCMNE